MRNTNNFNRQNGGQSGWLRKVPGFQAGVWRQAAHSTLTACMATITTDWLAKAFLDRWEVRLISIAFIKDVPINS